MSASAQYYNNKPFPNDNYRINQGVRNGELTRHEAINLERQKANIRREAIRYRANDGRIDRRERRDLRKDQCRLNRNIYYQKHDNQRRF